MRLTLFINRLKGLLKIAVVASLTLTACGQTDVSQTENNPSTPLSEVQTLELDKSIEELKGYLETLKLYDVDTVQGSTHNERLKSLDWLNHDLADDLVKHGIKKDKLLKIAGTDTDVKKLVSPYHLGEASFEDYLKLAEIAVIARVGNPIPNGPSTYGGPGFFNLDVSDILSATTDVEKISVENSLNPHHRVLHTGQTCVFFLSPTYTKHFIAPGKEYPNLPDYLREDLPDSYLTSRYPTYCSKDGETFGKYDHKITRSEILGLAKTIP